MKRVAEILTVSLIGGLLPLSTMAAADDACEGLPSHAALRGALATATAAEVYGSLSARGLEFVGEPGEISISSVAEPL